MDRQHSPPSSRLPSLSRPPAPLFSQSEPLPPQDETYSPEEIRQITRTLSEYNIEIMIRSKRDKTRIFVFREGQGNLKVGLAICDRVLKEKLGVDLSRFLDSLNRL